MNDNEFDAFRRGGFSEDLQSLERAAMAWGVLETVND